ncbi:MAG: thiamine-phosphate kinase [Acidobacteriota bacterium]|nr:thiamine-phosphate kinase [Acidobacteriota bacterium]
MREIAIVDLIRQLSAEYTRSKTLIKGIGDDCAILRPNPKEDLVFTTDFLLEGRHFERDTHTAADVGRKALARSLSDLAAMGSEPVFCLVSLAIPSALAARWVKGFYAGFLALASRHRIPLAGGDLAQSDRVLVDVMCCGRVPRGKALTRSGAKPGDYVFVTGALGASANGFAKRRGANWKRHLRPEPRMEAGLELRRLRVSAAMDLSDGLSLDLARLCRESQVSAELSSIPFARGVTREEALHGGEDYELLFTASARAKIPEALGSLPVTRIGVIKRGNPGRVLFEGRVLKPKGFDHFA